MFISIPKKTRRKKGVQQQQEDFSAKKSKSFNALKIEGVEDNPNFDSHRQKFIQKKEGNEWKRFWTRLD